MKIKQYIEECRNKAQVKTNKELGMILGIDSRKLNFYENLERKADEITCFKLADFLDINKSLVIAEINEEWEKDEEKKNYFKEQIKKIQKNKFNIFLVILGIGALSLSGDNNNDNWLIAIASSTLTALYYRLRN